MRASVHERIPCVTPPAVVAVDGKICLSTIDGQELFLAKITAPAMQVALAPHNHSPFLATQGTHRRWWNQFFLPGKDWRDFLVEREILIRDFEWRTALSARLLHRKASIPLLLSFQSCRNMLGCTYEEKGH